VNWGRILVEAMEIGEVWLRGSQVIGVELMVRVAVNWGHGCVGFVRK